MIVHRVVLVPVSISVLIMRARVVLVELYIIVLFLHLDLGIVQDLTIESGFAKLLTDPILHNLRLLLLILREQIREPFEESLNGVPAHLRDLPYGIHQVYVTEIMKIF